jgi:hypothetical protein
MSLLGSLADAVLQTGGGAGLPHPAFISGALQEPSVVLDHDNASLYQSDLVFATAASGRTPLRGQSRPSTEVSSCYLM